MKTGIDPKQFISGFQNIHGLRNVIRIRGWFTLVNLIAAIIVVNILRCIGNDRSGGAPETCLFSAHIRYIIVKFCGTWACSLLFPPEGAVVLEIWMQYSCSGISITIKDGASTDLRLFYSESFLQGHKFSCARLTPFASIP
jgi:hypothetical protein